MAANRLTVNGESVTVDAPAEMPLLWVLRDVIGLTGTKYGCGIGLCGACTVHIDGAAAQSCLTPLGSVVEQFDCADEAYVYHSDSADDYASRASLIYVNGGRIGWT